MIGILTRPDDGRFIDANGISLYLEEHGDDVPVLAAAGFRVITPGHRPGARGRPCLGGSGRLADDDALPGPRPHADRDLGAASTCPGHRTPAGDGLVPAVLPVPRRRRGHHRLRRLGLAAHVQPWRRGPRAGDRRPVPARSADRVPELVPGQRRAADAGAAAPAPAGPGTDPRHLVGPRPLPRRWRMKNSASLVQGLWRYEEIPDASHWVPLDATGRLNELLLDWLR